MASSVLPGGPDSASVVVNSSLIFVFELSQMIGIQSGKALHFLGVERSKGKVRVTEKRKKRFSALTPRTMVEFARG